MFIDVYIFLILLFTTARVIFIESILFFQVLNIDYTNYVQTDSKPLLVITDGYIVNRIDIQRRDHAFGLDVAEQRDFPAFAFGNGLLGAAPRQRGSHSRAQGR